MNSWIVSIVVLILFAFLVPSSSRWPDAVQHVLGIPGGVDSARKAILGIAVAGVLVVVLVKGLRKFGGRP
jgi:hypothetical protein